MTPDGRASSDIEAAAAIDAWLKNRAELLELLEELAQLQSADGRMSAPNREQQRVILEKIGDRRIPSPHAWPTLGLDDAQREGFAMWRNVRWQGGDEDAWIAHVVDYSKRLRSGEVRVFLAPLYLTHAENVLAQRARIAEQEQQVGAAGWARAGSTWIHPVEKTAHPFEEAWRAVERDHEAAASAGKA